MARVFKRLVLSSTSFRPKLATFISPPLTASLKASHGARNLQTSHFKCYASASREVGEGIPRLGSFVPIPNVDIEVHDLGEFAVNEHNLKHGKKVQFIRVVAGESRKGSGTNYRLWIWGEEDEMARIFKAIVFVGPPGRPAKELASFAPVVFAKMIL